MEAGPVGRAVRAAMFAVVSVTLAATGHVLMSETPLPFWVLATAFLALAVLGWCFAARERGPWLVTTVAVVTQGVLHNAFAAAQSAPGTAEDGVPAAAMNGMDHMTMHQAPMGDAMAGMHHMAGMDHMAGMEHASAMAATSTGPMAHASHHMAGMSSTGMLAAHILAALVCGIWLARGERAAFQVLRAFAGRLLTPLQLLHTAPLPAPRRRLRPRRGLSDRPTRGLRCARARDRRGPPGVAAAS
ncbi:MULTISPECIES: hypothetical protein [unclassified Streptomyces]|uniref:hypothetical protein n=1 Tax=unclassified Streptomyces TaxID=2593676 RepID=UPI00036FD3F1|nr:MULTISPECIES: hypothetical protein [unclassified Streptomyces]MYQ79896.1 hypothetical protein [Streptomyces sp. SID4923]